jgi:sulfonate transport system substrate-binding protein
MTRRIGWSRRVLLAAALALAAAASITTPVSAETTAEVRIGYQKYGVLTIAKAQGGIDAKLAERGYDVRWIEFPAGPQLLEALNVGSIDLGTTGEAPLIFAQAAGAPWSMSATSRERRRARRSSCPRRLPCAASPTSRAARSPSTRARTSITCWCGCWRRTASPIATCSRSSCRRPTRAAFERGAVDAWAIWDPFPAAAQAATDARVLADGTGLVANHQFYLASRPFLDAHPDLVSLILDELRRSGEWALADPARAARLLSPQVGIPAEVLEVAVRRQRYGVEHLSEAVIAEQQRIADGFRALGLIPKPIAVREAVWTPSS